MAKVVVRMGTEEVEIGNLRSGESRFFFLPRRSSDEPTRFSVSFEDDGNELEACALRLNWSGQHAHVILYDQIDSVCTGSSPMFSDLLVAKFF